jgi:hypothetical protein
MHCSEPRLCSPLLEAPGEYKVESATSCLRPIANDGHVTEHLRQSVAACNPAVSHQVPRVPERPAWPRLH